MIICKQYIRLSNLSTRRERFRIDFRERQVIRNGLQRCSVVVEYLVVYYVAIVLMVQQQEAYYKDNFRKSCVLPLDHVPLGCMLCRLYTTISILVQIDFLLHQSSFFQIYTQRALCTMCVLSVLMSRFLQRLFVRCFFALLM